MKFRMFGGALAATTVCLTAIMSGCSVLSSGDIAMGSAVALESRGDLQTFAWTQSADAGRILTFAYKDVNSVGTYLSDVAQRSLTEVIPAFEVKCQKKGQEAAIDFVSGMAIREMRDAAEYEALQESVGVLIKKGMLPTSIDFETVDQVKSRVAENSPAYEVFVKDFAQRKSAKLKALEETRAKQKAQLMEDTVSECMKPLREKEAQARSWQDLKSVTQNFIFEEPSKPSRATIVFTWADGRTVEKEMDAGRLYEALTSGSTLTEFLQANKQITRSIIGDE